MLNPRKKRELFSQKLFSNRTLSNNGKLIPQPENVGAQQIDLLSQNPVPCLVSRSKNPFLLRGKQKQTFSNPRPFKQKAWQAAASGRRLMGRTGFSGGNPWARGFALSGKQCGNVKCPRMGSPGLRRPNPGQFPNCWDKHFSPLPQTEKGRRTGGLFRQGGNLTKPFRGEGA